MTEPTSDEQGSHDPVEQQLGATLHRLADDAPATPVDGGRALVERRVRQRAARKRQAMGVGMAAAVVALVGGVAVLRPDPATSVSFGDSPASSPAAGNVTGYATGSITGSPHGWTSNYDDTGGGIDLPKLTVDLGPEWSPIQLSSTSSSQGAGESPTPLLVLADGTSYVVVSVQPVADLGPGKGEPAQVGGHDATLVRRSNGVLQAVVNLDGATRALVASGGIDEATLSSIVGTLRQQDGAWVADPPAGSTLQPVATVVPSSYQQRTVSWNRPLAATGATTTTLASEPTTILAGSDGETVQFSVSTGGAYEFYGLVAQRSGWSRIVPVADGRTKLAGVDVVAAVSMEDSSGGSSVVAYDAQGLVYQIDRFLLAPAPTVASPAGLAAMTLQVVAATEARWTDLVTTAAQQRIQRAAEEAAAVDRKMAEIEASGGDPAALDGAVATTSPPTIPLPPAGAPPAAVFETTTSITSPPAAPATTTP